jgi:hypothetical protein
VLEEALAFLATWDKVPKSQLLEVRHWYSSFYLLIQCYD